MAHPKIVPKFRYLQTNQVPPGRNLKANSSGRRSFIPHAVLRLRKRLVYMKVVVGKVANVNSHATVTLM
jgi:hypothetical protein